MGKTQVAPLVGSQYWSPLGHLAWCGVVGDWVADVQVAGLARGCEVGRVITCDGAAMGVVHLVSCACAHALDLLGALPVVAAGWG